MDASLAERTSKWLSVDVRERRAIADAIAEASRGKLSVARVDEQAGVLHHRPSGILFHLVPGGTTRVGFDLEQRDQLRAEYQYWDECDEVEFALERFDKAVADVTVAPFLLAACPLSGDQLEAILAGRAAEGKGRGHPNLEEIAKLPAAQYVGFLESFPKGTFEDAQITDIEGALERVGLRFPSESEWEHAARAGTRHLFPHGNSIPHSPNLGMNPLGFSDLGADADICADGWVPSVEGIPTDGRPRPPGEARVARGGAAACYPWQGCAEWTLLLCGARAPSSAHEGFLTARPAVSL